MSKDYEVGYGKPPKTTRFSKGQSGNPKGRPKGTRNFKTDFEEELHSRIHVREGGKAVIMSKQRALVKSLIAKALNADPRAIAAALQLIQRYSPEMESQARVGEPLSHEEEEILEVMKDRLRKEAIEQSTANDVGPDLGPEDAAAALGGEAAQEEGE